MTMRNRLEHTCSDIEDCVTSNRLFHNDAYHVVNDEEKARIQKELLDWYQREKRTTMPWRQDNDKTWDREVIII